MLSLLFEYLFRGLVLCILLALGYLYLTRKADDHVNRRRKSSSESRTSNAGPCTLDEDIEDIEKMEWTDEDSQEYRAVVQKGGIPALQAKIEANLNKWKNIVVQFAIIGESGAGKSSFINAMLDKKNAEEDGSAKVGCNETTMECEEYKHPTQKAMSFWDLPGVGTPKFLKDNYLEAIKFRRYDFFILITQGRFKENDLWLVKEIEKQGKTFYFVRTKIDNDVTNDKRAYPKKHNRSQLLKNIKETTQEKLKEQGVKNTEVFLIDNHAREQFDFKDLVKRLINDVPELKKQSLIFSISALSSDVIKEKVKALRSRVKYMAVVASMGSLVPVPGAGFACEIGIIILETKRFKEQLETDQKSLQKLADKMEIGVDALCKKIGISTHVVYSSASRRLMLKFCGELVTSEATESVLKIAIPLLGSIISTIASVPLCAYTLYKILNTCEQEAYRAHEEFQRWVVDRTSSCVD